MITKEDVEHIGWLARIDISEQETVEHMEKLNSVLGYFGQLDELPTEDVAPTYHVAEIHNVFRMMWKKNVSRRKLFLKTPNTNRMEPSEFRR